MAEVRWTPQAADDLEAITTFIAKDSASYATLFAMDSLAAVERLSEFPYSGRIVPEVNDPAVREILFGNYHIVYRVNENLVELLTMYHGARLLDPSGLIGDADCDSNLQS
ncbi:MAG: type II toxin-antitoxin system RelE/ParE family toxin [Chlorobaculum sp.]|nr:type II toxin-antitoxin system RelE/ParE family toxin [Chlorobaculum sp.]